MTTWGRLECWSCRHMYRWWKWEKEGGERERIEAGEMKQHNECTTVLGYLQLKNSPGPLKQQTSSCCLVKWSPTSTEFDKAHCPNSFFHSCFNTAHSPIAPNSECCTDCPEELHAHRRTQINMAVVAPMALTCTCTTGKKHCKQRKKITQIKSLMEQVTTLKYMYMY